MKKRTLVIGDIHGGLEALKQVVDRAKVSANDTLIFLGDYVDGWSEAAETIDFLMALSKSQDCVFIRGNHDDLCLNWLQTGEYNPQWLLHGGKATMESYKNFTQSKKVTHIQFLQNLKNYFLDAQNRLFVHAGFTNEKGVAYEFFPKVLYWDRTLWEMVLALDKNLPIESLSYPKRLKVYNEIYIGHTVLSRIGETTPQNRANVWNIDTAAALKGPLTIFDINSKNYWQSEPVYTLYPNEKGRN